MAGNIGAIIINMSYILLKKKYCMRGQERVEYKGQFENLIPCHLLVGRIVLCNV